MSAGLMAPDRLSPGGQVGSSARATSRAWRSLPFRAPALGERREQAEVHVHRLEVARVRLAQVAQQRARAPSSRAAAAPRRRAPRGDEQPGEQAQRRRLDVALDAGHLPGEVERGRRAVREPLVEQLGRADEACCGAPSRSARTPPARAPGSCGRSAAARRSAASSGSRPGCRACPALSSWRSCTTAYGVAAAARIDEARPASSARTRASRRRARPSPRSAGSPRSSAAPRTRAAAPCPPRRSSVDEARGSRSRSSGAFEVVASSPPCRSARGAEQPLVVEAVGVHDRRDRVVEVERVAAQRRARARPARRTVSGPRGHDREPVGQLGHLLRTSAMLGSASIARADLARERDAVDRQRRAGGHAVRVRRRQHERARAAQLLVQRARPRSRATSERRLFEQTSSASSSVCVRRRARARAASRTAAPGRRGARSCHAGLAAGEPAADHLNRFRHPSGNIALRARSRARAHRGTSAAVRCRRAGRKRRRRAQRAAGERVGYDSAASPRAGRGRRARARAARWPARAARPELRASARRRRRGRRPGSSSTARAAGEASGTSGAGLAAPRAGRAPRRAGRPRRGSASRSSRSSRFVPATLLGVDRVRDDQRPRGPARARGARSRSDPLFSRASTTSVAPARAR